jgi:hypothetical protein
MLHEALPSPTPKTFKRERTVIGRIFQALLTQTDTVALIYKILPINFLKPKPTSRSLGYAPYVKK